MSNMGKGAGYYLTRSKSLLIDTAIVAILAIFMSFAMQMDALQSKGEDYSVLSSMRLFLVLPPCNPVL